MAGGTRRPEAVFLGVRHHSPACASLVARTVRELRPAHVLIEGPADLNPRLDELLLGHELPVAVFSHYRDEERTATSWAPLCAYSPEWVALTEGRAAGAQVRFVDLPAWHPAFTDRVRPLANRFADAEARYAEATERLCRAFGTDSPDTLWDGLFELPEPDGLAERLDAYFALVRGDAAADEGDAAREAYMARWVRAALARGDGPVLVVTGGFHTPALRALAASGAAGPEWPEVPRPPEGAVGGSHLVPYSFRQLDAFGGYQSGMPSPGYYQLLWERGPQGAADGLVAEVVRRLRAAKVRVSTADLIAARTLAEGLAAMRGHRTRSRADVLDGLVSGLVGEALDQPLPWQLRGRPTSGTDPLVRALVAAGTGERRGRLHPDTPAPPLVHDVAAEQAVCGVEPGRAATADLTTPEGLRRSRFLHRLRVLGVPGHARESGPTGGGDPVFTEHWAPSAQGWAHRRDAALIEAGAYGAQLSDAAAVALAERARAADADPTALAGLLFDAVLCGVGALTGELLETLTDRIGRVPELGAVGDVLAATLDLWRHDRIYGVGADPRLAGLVDAALQRVLWLSEGLHGGTGVDHGRLRAATAARDALRHAAPVLTLPRSAALATAARVAADPAAPPDLRGAALGLRWSLSADGTAAASEGTAAAAFPAEAVAGQARALAGEPERLGDWLSGLFVLAREQLTGPALDTVGDASLFDALDAIVTGLPTAEFLSGLPALRQAFGYFPPRERERIAQRLLALRGRTGSARGLLRTSADPALLARAAGLELAVTDLLSRYGLSPAPTDTPTGTPTGTPTDPEPADLPEPTGSTPVPAPSPAPPSAPLPDEGLERWRLILGAAAERCTGGLGELAAAQDAALEWLYGRDPEAGRRGVRRSGPGTGGSRSGGSEASRVTPVDWLEDVHRLFPKETVERLERDAVERYGIDEIVTDPEVLSRVEPSPALLRAVLRTKHLMNPELLSLARRLVEAVVRELLERLRPEVRRAFTGARAPGRSRIPLARDFDFRSTVRANLAHYQPEQRRLLIERPYFHTRTRRTLEQWQLVLLVDQSGSMAGSVIHSAVTAACLWNLPGLRTHLVAFDTSVVDLTEDVTDPVELLMRVQLGGGTDIARAVDYGAGLLENPRRSIVVLVSDFYEGGDTGRLLRGVRKLVEQGTTVLGLAALDEEADPVYDRELAARLVGLGAHVGAMTPGALAAFVAEKVGR
ncbi:hypothetical protein Kpho02_32150 [Kitasatospora phosalacinea]|uniref:VWFA domain-containing protein n=1 Tax=Kitasatospora phosalacinea TaxID=2065 RepID=A0A9W6Q8V9_9ACTN|nr:DUF5682 family protein [Kitasatospora phosalacinea]GLW70916.1 hypothetical protein Kpho02_32150 [Kitasatospora phosalacinea]